MTLMSFDETNTSEALTHIIKKCMRMGFVEIFQVHSELQIRRYNRDSSEIMFLFSQ